jgi:hypothetical protein
MASQPNNRLNSNQYTRVASALSVDSSVTLPVPKNCSLRRANATTGESSSPLAADSISDRVRMICERVPAKCGSVLANNDGRIMCIVCPEPHKISPWYSPLGYAIKTKGQREAKIAAGYCAECGRKRDTTSARLCSIHLRMKAARKKRYLERIRHASLEALYSTSTRGHADGSATPTYDLRDETADIVL